ncbi:MAG: CYTH and CHAD domain-containing protein [Parvibaculaceae bacterium]|nr:CYTH and CHAD domain-containing protein [Parvibaculaceae bacterium]
MAGETTQTAPQEIELKLELTAPALKAFRASSLFQEMGLESAPKHKLRSTYFDTSDRQLKAHKIALRVRDDGQGRLIQTLKTSGVPGDIASVREEHEVILSSQDPLPNLAALPLVWRTLVEKLAAQSPLQPLFETQVTRQAALIVTPQGDKIEVAVDQGWVIAGSYKHQIREVEFEHVSGQPAALHEQALALLKIVPVRIGTVSKSQRGYSLPTPHTHPAQRAKPIPLSPSLTVEEALADIIRQNVRQIMANEPALIEAKNPEGVHQMRVTFRRLRASLQGFATWLGDPALLAFSKEAQVLATSLGHTRDMDVFETDILLPVLRDFPGHIGIEKLLRKSKKQRAMAWKDCLAVVASEEFTRFLLRLNLYVEQKAWRENAEEQARLNQPVQSVARSILKRLRVKLQASAEGLATLTIDERHEMRKRIKKLRYMSVFFSDIFENPEPDPENGNQSNYLKQLAALQNRFGALNDVAMAEEIVQEFTVSIGRKSNDISEAIGIIIGWHMRRAHKEWSRIPLLWEEFSALPDFWDEKNSAHI